MSLVGKRVEARGYKLIINGFILDKYLGNVSVEVAVPSGMGGTMAVVKHLNKEYYIIEDEKSEIHHIECSGIIKILKDE